MGSARLSSSGGRPCGCAGSHSHPSPRSAGDGRASGGTQTGAAEIDGSGTGNFMAAQECRLRAWAVAASADTEGGWACIAAVRGRGLLAMSRRWSGEDCYALRGISGY